MKNYILAFIIPIFLIVFIPKAYSQDIARNTFYAELGGATMFYSVNYERMLTSNNEINFPIRIGLSATTSNVYDGDETLWIPMSISFVKHLSKAFYFETRLFVTPLLYQETYYGKGGSVLISSENIVDYVTGLSVGFRRQPKLSGIYYHIHIQAQLFDNKFSVPYLSLGLGYAF